MPEMPEMQALAERLDRLLTGLTVERVEQLGFTGLKTVSPRPDELVGRQATSVTRRGKFVVISFTGTLRVLLHLSQAGRLDVERPPKRTRPRGAVVRLVFTGGPGVLVREHGTERKAGWWVLAGDDEGPLSSLGPEATSAEFAALVAEGDSTRQLHTLLRDQRVVAGLGRGWTDDILNRAGLSPFASLRSLSAAQREGLSAAVVSVLEGALALERDREDGLSEAKLGGRFAVHNRAGQPCPVCGATLHRVSFESHEIAYCPTCQTGGRVLADRRLSRLLR